jgi:K+-transporting ATPase ATPase B chain
MIAMVEGANRQKTPNEIALTILLVALTLIFLMATVTLMPFSLYAVSVTGAGAPASITVLIALLVCLIPTTIGGLLSAIGVAGIGRMMQKNVVATSGRAVEAAGDVDVLLLDKTGTITLGNRQASAFVPMLGVTLQRLADAAQLASLTDQTPEGRSIVVLAKNEFGIRERDVGALNAVFVPFSAHTRMSGVDLSPQGAMGQNPADSQGCGGCHQDLRHRARRPFSRGHQDTRRRGRAPWQYAAGRRRGFQGSGGHRTQGHREGRHQGALRRTARHGYQDHHDHGR